MKINEHNNYPYNVGDKFTVIQDRWDKCETYEVTIIKRDGDTIHVTWINDDSETNGDGEHDLANIRECLNKGQWKMAKYIESQHLDEELFHIMKFQPGDTVVYKNRHNIPKPLQGHTLTVEHVWNTVNGTYLIFHTVNGMFKEGMFELAHTHRFDDDLFRDIP